MIKPEYIILGLLLHKNMHPYEILQVIKERRWDLHLFTKKGSLYYQIKKLLEVGDIRIAGVERESNRPERTIYALTTQGRDKIITFLSSQFTKEFYFSNPLCQGLLFIDSLPAEQTLIYLQDKLEELTEKKKEGKEILQHNPTKLTQEEYLINLGMIYQLEAEEKWIKDIIAIIREKKAI